VQGQIAKQRLSGGWIGKRDVVESDK